MFLSLESLAALATIIGTALSLFALVQSRAWLMLVSLLVVVVGIASVLYGRRERLARESATNVIEGLSIDTLNLANLRQKADRKYFIQTAEHLAFVDGADLQLCWQYQGYSRAAGVSSFDFSVESGLRPFEDLDCVAYDLVHDPMRQRPIKPILIGPESISKRVTFALLETLNRNDRFDVLVKCTLKGCLTPGVGYYSSTLCFAQRIIQRCTVRLEFSGEAPEWVRVYECKAGSAPRLVKSLVAPSGAETWRYEDVIHKISGQSARVYFFNRPAV